MLRRHLSDYNTLKVLVKSEYVQMQIHFLHNIPVWEPIRTRASRQTGNAYQGNCIKLTGCLNGLLSPTRQLPQIAATQNLMPAAQCLPRRNAYQGNCIKLGQTHVRLPESGRGAPCGCPSLGITPKKTIGRGAPCGRPSSAILASELRCVCPVTPTHHHCAPLPAHSQDQRHQPRQ